MKRFITIGLILAAILSLLTGTTMGADLLFVAVDDAIPLTLTTESTPVYQNGMLYLPHTVFAPSPLRVTASYNVDSNSVLLFSRTKRLNFDITAGTMTTEDGTVTPAPTFIRNGLVFLPAGYCATHFNFRISLLTSLNSYPIIRITTGAQVYDDRAFVRQAENLISYRVEQYLAENPQKPEPPITDQPVIPPVTQPEPDEPDVPPEITPATVYLTITDAATMTASLAILERYDLPAAFFFTAEEIPSHGNLIRQLLAKGYTIGLTVPEETSDPDAALMEANTALDLVCKRHSLLALLPRSAALPDGYRCFLIPEAAPSAYEIAQAEDIRFLFLAAQDTLDADLHLLVSANVQFGLLQETTRLSD